MDRMRTFTKYALWIVLFFIFSTIVSNVLLSNSFHKLNDNVSVAESEDGLKVETIEAKSNKMSGTYRGKVTNTSEKEIPLKYVRIRSYNDSGKLLQTKYVKLENMKPGETREFQAKFDVGGISSYDVDYVDEMPDDRTILDKAWDGIKGFLASNDKLGYLKDLFSNSGFDNVGSSLNLGDGSGVFSAYGATYYLRAVSLRLPMWAWATAGIIVITSIF